MNIGVIGGMLALLITAGAIVLLVKRNYPLSILCFAVVLIPAFEQYNNDFGFFETPPGAFRLVELIFILVSLCWGLRKTQR
ncbi:MAG: putative tellurium resistance membrane protein TerC [Lentimonas sp.]|jgi:predicted tellurium resistance membrane protein TerC